MFKKLFTFSSFLIIFSYAAFASAAHTFVVNSIGDEADGVLDGTCLTAIGKCTLRAAVDEANTQTGIDTIEFNIKGAAPFVIKLGSSIVISEAVIIDGKTQLLHGAPAIVLDGQDLAVSGLSIVSGEHPIHPGTVA